jgi:hypothetical protein
LQRPCPSSIVRWTAIAWVLRGNCSLADDAKAKLRANSCQFDNQAIANLRIK